MRLKTSPAVSVALCTWNGERYLNEQLESISRQTLLPTELVVCDDGSRDATIEILNGFARCASFPVRIFRNLENLGSTRNFEQAIRLCQGELIALCDQDDWWAPTKLEVLGNHLAASGAGAIFSDGLLMDEGSRPTGSTLWQANRFDCRAGGFLEDSGREAGIAELLKRNVVTGATFMFRSELRDLLLPVPAEWVHDGWLAWMVVLHSKLLAHPEELIRYRVHTSQQVGMPPRSLRAKFKRARCGDEVAYRSLEKELSVLLHYAENHPEVCSANLCRSLDEKRRFAAFRSDLKSSRWLRWKAIGARRSAYHVYAQGWGSMLKDALR